MKKLFCYLMLSLSLLPIGIFADNTISDSHKDKDKSALAFTEPQNIHKIIDYDSATANQINTPSPFLDYFPDIGKIVKRGTLRIGVNTFSSNEPFIIENPKGEFSGLDIEISKDFCNNIGVKPEFNYKAQNIIELFKMLASGEIDIAVGDLSRSFERMKYVYFSKSYAVFYHTIIMNNDDLKRLGIEKNPFKYLSENDVKIGVESETAYVEFAQLDFPKATLVKYPPDGDGFGDLQKHKILVGFGDSNEFAAVARKFPEIALHFTMYILADLKVSKGIAVSPINPNLLSLINSYLEMHDVNYELEDLIEKYPDVYKCE